MATKRSSILVCQAGSCLRKGSQAVLAEIEELANAVGGHCNVKGSGCLGLCNQAPNAVVLHQRSRRQRHRRQRQAQEERYFTRLHSLTASAAVVTEATGQKPPLDDPDTQARLAGVRAFRARQQAIAVYRWNAALQATEEELSTFALKSQASQSINSKKELEVRKIYRQLWSKVGFPAGAPRSNDTAIPTEIHNYVPWLLEKVTVVSSHSAVFHFRTKDRKRGTPHPRGGGKPPPAPVTWHTTMLAHLGWNTHEEGPLPWIERDYTPISGAKEWESGRCDLLVKIYQDGAATSWLQRQAQPLLQHQSKATSSSATDDVPSCQVWLSQPVPTLSVPYLVPSDQGTDDPDVVFRPASVLLLLAGTGIVALAQILHCREPTTKLGIATRTWQKLQVPLDLVFSTREDDILMLPEITAQSRRGSEAAGHRQGIRQCTLLLTRRQTSRISQDETPTNNACPFPDFSACDTHPKDDSLEQFQSLPNARMMNNTRLNPTLVADSVSRMPAPCRIVVSGPSGFNMAAREMLRDMGVEDDTITVLEA